MKKQIWSQESLSCKIVTKSIVKDFLLQNIKKSTLQKKKRTKIVRGKAKQKDDKNEFKKGQTDTAGAFWIPTKCNFMFFK